MKTPTPRAYKIFGMFMSVVGIAILIAGAMMIPALQLNAVILIAVGGIFLLNGRRWMGFAKQAAEIERKKKEEEGAQGEPQA
ncbi:MAG: hypothetical protein IJA51_00735 [Oscillospiraceae bacterium]|nr:hypothetical protein [Oscillospiraceae bacterium]